MTQKVPFDNPALFAWRRFAVDGLLRLGRTDEARALADDELVIARRWGARHEIGASLRARGLVEGGAEGQRLLEEAVAMFEGTESQLQHARALIDLGAAYRRDGQRTKARDVLTRGVDLALRTGVLGLVERGNEELASTGARPRKNLVTGLDALTPERAPRRRARRRRAHEQGDRAGALRHGEDRRGPPLERLPQAADHLAPRAGGGARRPRHGRQRRVGQSTESRSTTNTSGSCGWIAVPAPRAP